MKIKIQKKIFTFGILISTLPIIIVSSLFLFNKNDLSSSNNVIESKLNNSTNEETKNITPYELGSVTETESTYTFKPNAEIPWANTKKANEISAGEIKDILISSKIDAIFHVEIKSVDLLNGQVTFELSQTIRTFTEGIITTTQNKKINAVSGNGSGTDWKTPIGLLIADKYNFEWRSNQDIGLFLKDTNLTPSQLTKQIVIDEMIKSGGNFKLPQLADISINFSDVSSGSQTSFGVVKVVIEFSNTQTTSWVGDKIPSQADRTLILRGMNNSSGQKSEMNFSQLKTSANIGAITIADKNIFGNVLLANENTISNLYPSEFVSLNNGDLFSLINMFQKGTYLQSSTKLVDLIYMGVSITDANFATTTGIPATTVSQLGLYNIITEANDLNGSLKLVYQYKYYDVFYNSILEYSASQVFAPNTFKINPDTNKTLAFDWKTNADVQSVGSSYDIVNLFHKTINDANLSKAEKEKFKINYANNFFTASSDVYAKTDREFNIDYVGGTKQINGTYIPIATEASKFNQIQVTITFNSWNGYIYEETVGNSTIKKDGFKSSTIYSMPSYQYSTGKVNWTNNESLSDLSTKLPSEIAYDISKNIISTNRFFSSNGLSNIQIVILPNDSLGSLNFKVIGYVSGSLQTYQNVFVGFVSNNIGNNVLQFGWLPQIDLPQNILGKPMEEVTDEEVLTYFTANNPLFQSGIINSNDISIKRDKASNSIYIIISFNFFNQSLTTPGNQTFYTRISGFEIKNTDVIAELKEPLNLTLVLSASLGGLIGLPLLIYFIIVFTKFIKYAQSKKKKDGK